MASSNSTTSLESIKLEDQSNVPTMSSTHRKFLGKLLMPDSRPRYSLVNKCLAEAIGTMLIVILGVGAVCNSLLAQENVPLWHVTTAFGIGVTLAIVMTCDISGAHLNPAVSLAMAIFRPESFSGIEMLAYWVAQYIGGFLGGAFNLMIFNTAFKQFEADNNIIRGAAESIVTASAFGEYFPVPGGVLKPESVTIGTAFLVETWATAILIFVIFCVTDSAMKSKKAYLAPIFIGATVAILLNLYVPFTQGCLNPARDFGPRLVAAIAGWGKVAIPGPRNGFWIYILAPKLGGVIGALLYTVLIRAGNPGEFPPLLEADNSIPPITITGADIEQGQGQRN